MINKFSTSFKTFRKFVSEYSSVHLCSSCRTMCSPAGEDTSVLIPPPDVRGMTKLEKGKFSKHIVVPWLELDEKLVSKGMNVLKKYLLRVINLKPLRPTCELLNGEEVLGIAYESVLTGSPRRVLLNPLLIKSIDDFEKQDREKLEKLGISGNLQFSKILLGYDNWKADEILKAVLPEDNLTSYSIIGHIVHVNIRDNLLPFKEIIGEVLLEKVIGAKTVVNKTDIIDSTFRNFKMEVLCGTENMVTRTKEHGCVFDLDFSAVYWNPRLATEHERITSKLKCGDVLYDVFAGIGPFSVPAGKRKCNVLANDLNPASYKWLNANCKLNKVQQFVKTFNKDGRKFIEEDIRKDMIERLRSKKIGNGLVHITMNLPASAVNFLSAFCGLLNGVNVFQNFKNTPMVHVYCFASGENSEVIAQTLVEEKLGSKLDENLMEVCYVRNVAPNKEMMRVSFKLSWNILTANLEVSPKCNIAEEKDSEVPCAKRICLSSDVVSAK